MNTPIHTIGHSTRTRAELVDLLRHYGIELLVDIRKIPYSRYNPQFNREDMMRAMPEAGIAYEHCDDLGGVRPPQEVVERAKSCSERSRGFAGYMQTPPFRRGLEHVLALAGERRIALMCAEANPSHCHRFWVADAIVEAGVPVVHIISMEKAEEHPRNLFTY
ncbi:MAG TPA: DUF488 domain-containing protein [Candidatus Kapabacteria bacterium]|nr:DUF488 domain-containing protein [Candidatus Kapabacteria bacterium]